jgi:AcrR family transcriptional regulator
LLKSNRMREGSRVSEVESVTDRAQRSPQVEPDGDARATAVAVAIDLFRVRAFNDVTLEAVASSASIPIEAMREEFESFDLLVVEVIRVWNQQRMAPILAIATQQGAAAFLRQIVIANVEDPALMRLLSAVAHIAATPGHPMAPVLQSEWVRFHALVQRALTHDAAVGREPVTMEPARGAEQLIAMYEGLQLQSMLRPNMDVVEAYDRAVTRLRHGWSEAYRPPVWPV